MTINNGEFTSTVNFGETTEFTLPAIGVYPFTFPVIPDPGPSGHINLNNLNNLNGDPIISIVSSSQNQSNLDENTITGPITGGIVRQSVSSDTFFGVRNPNAFQFGLHTTPDFGPDRNYRRQFRSLDETIVTTQNNNQESQLNNIRESQDLLRFDEAISFERSNSIRLPCFPSLIPDPNNDKKFIYKNPNFVDR